MEIKLVGHPARIYIKASRARVYDKLRIFGIRNALLTEAWTLRDEVLEISTVVDLAGVGEETIKSLILYMGAALRQDVVHVQYGDTVRGYHVNAEDR